jgi:hypothetical protein
MKVYILSGHTGPGGSTSAFIMLTNALNNADIKTTFYGSLDYPNDKCNYSKNVNEIFENITSEDIFICHFLSLNKRPNVKKLIFVSHETYWSEIKDLPKIFDEVVFLHKEHRDYHKEYKGKYSIIPNLKPELSFKEKSDKKDIAGIIGSIEERKQTHISILRALEDGCKKIYLFGNVSDSSYWLKNVADLLVKNPNIIFIKGFYENKQEMYDMIGKVYHSSKGEVASLVKDECFLTGTEFIGNNQTNNEVSELTNDQIIESWIKLFNK